MLPQTSSWIWGGERRERREGKRRGWEYGKGKERVGDKGGEGKVEGDGKGEKGRGKCVVGISTYFRPWS